MRKKIVFPILYIFLCSQLHSAFVTYELSGGRLGDNLLAFFHAKWISFTYKIPLLYKPFNYSDQLNIKGAPYTPLLKKSLKKIIVSTIDDIDPTQKIIYSVPYFSEDKTEFALNPHWIYFQVDWENQLFKKVLQESIKPCNATVATIKIPKNHISVAVHIRKGGGVDYPLLCERNPQKAQKKNRYYADTLYPLKFPPLSFYIEQIKKISEILNNTALFIYIFTDDKHPSSIVKKLKKELFNYPNITFAYRKKGNAPDKNVIEDFFALTKFDCLIRSQSNFSFCAAQLTSYNIEIFPIDYSMQDNKPVIHTVKIIHRKDIAL